ncbi:unnamed protein product [Thlaspi arvense]|uniref:NAC domain-containing protein n=1 Tax=Thlaspi arvense TaxID=13288 RepID=A0AAU9RUM1_THLAR|nr:unnamed protein product [Thlaspi arvense]
MEDHSESSEDDDDLIEPADEVIISYYLKMMMNNSKSWPNHFLRDEYAHVYNLNPNYFVKTQSPNYFVFVKRRTEACGKTDGSESGCWRIMGRDKLIKSEETGKILGFKKILKFCDKERKREEEDEDQGIWVMEEYSLVSKWKQDQVICKIRLLLQPEVTSLLAKQFSLLTKSMISPFSRRRLMPRWDFWATNVPRDEIITIYLKLFLGDNRNEWPRPPFLRSEQVYGVEPWRIVWPLHTLFVLHMGHYFFVNKTETSGRTDGCDGGCWRIIRHDKVIISKRTKEVLGFKRFYKFYYSEKPKFAKPVFKFEEDENKKVAWVMEEYRVTEESMQGKVICRIRLLFAQALDYLIRDAAI